MSGPTWRNDLSQSKTDTEKVESLIRYIKIQAENQNIDYPPYEELLRVAKRLVPYYHASGRWDITFHMDRIIRVSILCRHPVNEIDEKMRQRS